MNEKPIMVFDISVDPSEITEMDSPYGSVSILPFHGKVKSDLFSGETLPGAADVQQENPAGLRHMSARYAFRGKDLKGLPCTLFVENEGWFRGSQKHDPVILTCPKFLTDSSELAPYLSQPRFRAEVRGSENSVQIWVFDTLE